MNLSLKFYFRYHVGLLLTVHLVESANLKIRKSEQRLFYNVLYSFD